MLIDFSKILQFECQLDRENPIVVGVSGGADSMCLVDVLAQEKFPIIVAHFDHQLRSESSSEAEIVYRYAQERGIQYILGSEDVKTRAEMQRESLEEAARNARYQFLFQCAEDSGAQAVMVGHTADDQVESVLMHLLRGSGLDGLSGMAYCWLPNAWHAEIPLMRPLLSTWRRETLAYCEQRSIPTVSDPTNQDLSYFRNRLRLELIPYLETFNPALRKLIWQSAEVLRGDRDLIARLVDDAWRQVLVKQDAGYVAIDIDLSRDFSLGLQRRLMRRAIAQLRPSLRDISFDDVERGVEQIREMKPFAKIDIAAGLKLVLEPGFLWVAEWDSDLPTDMWPQVSSELSELEIGDTIALQSGWLLAAEKTEKTAVRFEPEGLDEDTNQAWLDLGCIKPPLLVRARREGDRFQPLGMQGQSQKLSDFMINQKIPRRARDRWPLVCSGRQIIWVAGYRPAESVQITPQTGQVLKLSLRRKNAEKQ
jgi:tRNA(Ile)-lysidine synthase